MPTPPGRPGPRRSSSGGWTSLPPIGQKAFDSTGRRYQTGHGAGTADSPAFRRRRPLARRSSFAAHDIGQDRTRALSNSGSTRFSTGLWHIGSPGNAVQLLTERHLGLVVTSTVERRADRSDRACVALFQETVCPASSFAGHDRRRPCGRRAAPPVRRSSIRLPRRGNS